VDLLQCQKTEKPRGLTPDSDIPIGADLYKSGQQGSGLATLELFYFQQHASTLETIGFRIDGSEGKGLKSQTWIVSLKSACGGRLRR
jgi:hypothetical protein